jgi:hypothetical protein
MVVHLHLEPPGETLLAVATGAVLATLGGIVGTQLEVLSHRRERQRNAALLFGEILSSLENIVSIADQSRGRGAPYGPVTLRLVIAARREITTYEAHRALLYDIRKAELRIRIHVLMVRLTMGFDGVTDATAEIVETEARARRAGHATPELEAGLAEQNEARAAAFDYALLISREIKDLVSALEPLAGIRFDDLARYTGDPFATGQGARSGSGPAVAD